VNPVNASVTCRDQPSLSLSSYRSSEFNKEIMKNITVGLFLALVAEITTSQLTGLRSGELLPIPVRDIIV